MLVFIDRPDPRTIKFGKLIKYDAKHFAKIWHLKLMKYRYERIFERRGRRENSLKH